MNDTTLTLTLQAVLTDQSKPRIKLLALFLVILFQSCTVNLAIVAARLNPKVERQSNERRLSRFLSVPIAQEHIAKIVLALIGFFENTETYVICIDRTNWKLGKINNNFLVIGIVYLGYALPLAWVNLEKAGNSNAEERKTLLKQVLKVVSSQRIYGFAADREFIGQDWFKALLELKVNPVIRLKSDTMVQHRLIKAPVSLWCRTLKKDEIQELKKARVYGVRVFMIVTLTDDGEILALVTQRRPSKALIIYRERWRIECLFKALKTSGFNLEDTHMTDKTRLEALFGVLVLGVAWSVVTGRLVQERRPEKEKKHGRLPRSIFKRGFEVLLQVLTFGLSKYVAKDEVFDLLLGRGKSLLKTVRY